MTNPFSQLKPAVPLDSLPNETSPQVVKPRLAAFLVETTFVEAETRRNQVGFACVFLGKTPGQKTASIRKIATLFSFDEQSVVASSPTKGSGTFMIL
jgi:hypothetical protein